MADQGGRSWGANRQNKPQGRDRPNTPRLRPAAREAVPPEENNPVGDDNDGDDNGGDDNEDDNNGNEGDSDDNPDIDPVVQAEQVWVDNGHNGSSKRPRIWDETGVSTIPRAEPVRRCTDATRKRCPQEEERQARNTREATKTLQDRLKDENKKFDGSDIFGMVLFIIVAEEILGTYNVGDTGASDMQSPDAVTVMFNNLQGGARDWIRTQKEVAHNLLRSQRVFKDVLMS